MAEDWAGRAAETYLEMKDKLAEVWGRQMLSHERPLPGVVRSVYDGGAVVYINYNDMDAWIDGLSVPALDYKVVMR